MKVSRITGVEGTGSWLIKQNNMATESTEEHEKIAIKAFIFPCSSVDSVAIK
jgi:hypothetical protein